MARRLMTIPGIGALGATALLATVGSGRQFQKVRDLAAWLGLVPREYSTGGKQKLLGISKRGNRYVRKVLVHVARSCFVILTEQEIDWGAGWMAFRLGCTPIKRSSHIPLKWPGLAGSS